MQRTDDQYGEPQSEETAFAGLSYEHYSQAREEYYEQRNEGQQPPGERRSDHRKIADGQDADRNQAVSHHDPREEPRGGDEAGRVGRARFCELRREIKIP